MLSEDNKKVKVSIMGACVSRDMFPVDHRYIIDKYSSFSNPIIYNFPSNNFEETVFDFLKPLTPNFNYTRVLYDAKKYTIDFLKEELSDFLVIDLADCRLPLEKYGDILLTASAPVFKNKNEFETHLGPATVFEPISFSDEEWFKCIDFLCEKILSMYPVGRIIINEYYLINCILQKDNNIKSYNSARDQKINALLKRLYARLKTNLNGCYLIPFLENVLTDENHRWGAHPLHYHQYYYDYAYKALQVITDGVNEDKKSINDHIETLRQLYSEKFLSIAQKVDENKIKNEKERLSVSCNHYDKYMHYFGDIIVNYAKYVDNVKRFFEDKKISHIAIWGDQFVADVFAVMFSKSEVSIDYIVNSGGCSQKFKTVLSEEPAYPNTEAIVFCDALTMSVNRHSVSEKINCPIFSISEIVSYCI